MVFDQPSPRTEASLSCLEDVETAIRWVKAHAAESMADPKRIALVGESAGGHLVSLAHLAYHRRLPPFLMVHGSADARVVVEQSRQFQTKVLAAGNSCDLLIVEGVGHGMVTWDNMDTSYKTKVIAWLRKTMR